MLFFLLPFQLPEPSLFLYKKHTALKEFCPLSCILNLWLTVNKREDLCLSFFLFYTQQIRFDKLM